MSASSQPPPKPRTNPNISSVYHYLESQPKIVDKAATLGLREVSQDLLNEKNAKYVYDTNAYIQTLPPGGKKEEVREKLKEYIQSNEDQKEPHDRIIKRLKKEVAEMLTDETHPQYIDKYYEEKVKPYFDLLEPSVSNMAYANRLKPIRYFLEENLPNIFANNLSDQQIKEEFYKYMIKNEGLFKTGLADPKDYLDENAPRKPQILTLNTKLAPEIEAYRTAHGYPEFPELEETRSINNKKLFNIINQPAPFTRLPTAPVMPTSDIPKAGAGRPTQDALQKAIMSIAPVPQSGAGITHTTPKSRGAMFVHSTEGEYVPEKTTSVELPKTKEESQKALAKRMAQSVAQPKQGATSVPPARQASAFGPEPNYATAPTTAPPKKQKNNPGAPYVNTSKK